MESDGKMIGSTTSNDKNLTINHSFNILRFDPKQVERQISDGQILQFDGIRLLFILPQGSYSNLQSKIFTKLQSSHPWHLKKCFETSVVNLQEQILIKTCLICTQQFYNTRKEEIESNYFIEFVRCIQKIKIHHQNVNSVKQIIFLSIEQVENWVESIYSLNFIVQMDNQYGLLKGQILTMIGLPLDKTAFQDLKIYLQAIGLRRQSAGIIEELEQIKLPEQILKLYTQENYYFSINIQLRRSNNVNTLLPLRYLISKLYQAINEFASQRSLFQKEVTTVKLYRGCRIGEKQAVQLQKSVGKTIENKFFMSTSQNMITINRFLKNCIIEIDVPFKNLDKNVPCGYCKLKGQMSHYQEQQEVLFNLYNSFRVDQVELKNIKRDKIWSIKLTHLGQFMEESKRRTV